MKHITLLLLISLFIAPGAGHSQGFLKAEGTKIVNGKGENVLLRGIGLGGWMLQEGYMLRINGPGQQHKIRARIEELVGREKTDAFYDAWLSNHTTKADIDSLKAWGFNSVRLPMHYNLYLDIYKGFALTDTLLQWCKENSMYLILDLHAAPGGQGNDLNISDRDSSRPSLWENEEAQKQTIALWKKIAAHYKDEPWIGAYDILNEPNFGFDDPQNDKNGLKEQHNAPLKKLLQEITTAIREADQQHMIIIEGNGWGNNYNGMLPPWDKNMALSFHKYWNFNDQQSIRYILDYRRKYNIPVWVGETGENSNVWFTEAIRLLEKNNIGWSWWPLKKLGVSNPLEIPSNDGYQQILNYWNGKGEKPDETAAFAALMELAQATNISNNILHRDVTDAMMRQPFTRQAKPFNANIITDNFFLPATDYDLGVNGAAYYDTDTANYRVSDPKMTGGNSGRAYRNDGVDIMADKDSADQYYVTDIEKGEWLQYTINAKRNGKYTLLVLVAGNKGNGKFYLTVNGKPVSSTIAVPAGHKGQWQTVDVKNVTLKNGHQTLRLHAEAGGFDFKAILFTRTPLP
ncbi:cellulase family glycosylhydrolase [Chitinophaga tropicalis]|uniref:Cellulase family glycosylhydrolase n=1 Tax=Chitinophaga tropicalis TaxID=2683588 RepID=A0A7K1U781_9BACT|nr:cellulase family glycosylhydrolase [Chitinophaga tropicalis]MVT10211.1 cellulase family glycosylhydrolase [Chitinophaga tropicalis]